MVNCQCWVTSAVNEVPMLIGLLRGNISNGKSEKNRILEFEDEFADLASRVQAFFWVLACIIGRSEIHQGTEASFKF